MAKKAGKRATAGKPKSKKNGHTKPTPEVLSDQQRQALLFSHKRKLVPLLNVEKNAKAAVNTAYEIAKKEGLPKRDLKLAISLESEEGIEAAKNDIERTHRIARWMGCGKQLDFFGDKETIKQRHYEDGRRAALNDEPARPPSHLGQADAQTWLEGHASGRTQLNAARAEGFRPLGAPLEDLMHKAAAGLAQPAQPDNDVGDAETVQH